MHTASQLHLDHFGVKLGDAETSCDQVFPAWNQWDRFGIVVTEPFGAVGSSLLLQLAIAMYYNVGQARKSQPLYPEIYVFHVGKMHGAHAWYDVFPARKEVLVPRDPALILEEINGLAITRLAVVDGPERPAEHLYKEPACARDRIVSAFSYSPTGRVQNSDIEIRALDRRAVTNTRLTLTPGKDYAASVAELSRADSDELAGGVPRLSPGERMQEFVDRSGEVDARIHAIRNQQRIDISTNGLPVETYRRLTVDSALNMLTNGS